LIGPGRHETPRLLLDEMFSPVIAEALAGRGIEVTAVAATAELRAMSDVDLFEWAAAGGYHLVTENVKDFARLLSAAQGTGKKAPGVLFTNSRCFPRSRRNPGPLIAALDAWLGAPAHPSEDWLQPT